MKLKLTFPTEEEFLAWRKENPNRGWPAIADSCPIAECLKDRGFKTVSVGTTCWGGVGRWLIFPYFIFDRRLPDWARRWICSFDVSDFFLDRRYKEWNP